MCHLVRQQQPEAAFGGSPARPASERPSPRWVVGAGAALLASFALAAFVAPGTPAPLSAKEAAAVPVVARTVATPATGVVEAGSGLVDDGVPATPEVARAGAGNCHHGL
jgi:hypothetical protein